MLAIGYIVLMENIVLLTLLFCPHALIKDPTSGIQAHLSQLIS